MAQLALRTYLHQDAPITLSTDLFVQDKLPPLEYFLSRTIATYPGLAILDSKKAQAEKMGDIAKSNYLPKFYMYGAYQLYQDDSLLSDMSPDWMVGLGMSLTLFDNGGRSSKVQAANSSRIEVIHLRAQAEQDLRLLVETTYREATQALEEYQGLESSQQLAAENLRMREIAFSQGMATSLDMVDANLSLAQVKTQRLQAAYHHIVALAKLTALCSNMANFSTYYSQQ